jgi:hypothetical protein
MSIPGAGKLSIAMVSAVVRRYAQVKKNKWNFAKECTAESERVRRMHSASPIGELSQ